MTETPNTSAVPPREPVLELRLEGIPDELKPLRQWMGWRYEWSGKKWVKTPKQVHGGVVDPWNARSNAPETWCSFDEAVSAYRARGNPGDVSWLDGIGIALHDGLHGVDLDDCRFLGDTLDDQALEVLRRVDGYAEVSPSGKGIKIFTRTNLARGYTSEEQRIELYRGSVTGEVGGGRWFTTTGHQINGHAALPAAVQDLDWLVERVVGARGASRAAPRQPAAAGPLSTQINLLRNHKAPLEDWPLERVKAELLPHLNPDVPNNEWVRVGLALHHQGGGEPEWLELWDEWSQRAPGRYNPGECEKRWESMGRREQTGADAGSVVTLASLLKETEHARAALSAAAAETAMSRAAGVLLAAKAAKTREDVDQLFAAVRGDEALQKLRVSMIATQKDSWRQLEFAARAALARLSGEKTTSVPIAMVRGLLSAQSAPSEVVALGDGPQPSGPLLEVGGSWVFDTSCDKYVHEPSGVAMTQAGFENEFTRFMPADNLGNKRSPVAWTRAAGAVRNVAGRLYHPARPQRFTMFEKEYSNSYRPSSEPVSRAPVTEEDWAAIRVVQEHFEFVVPDPRERGLLLSWIAHNVQLPGRKVRWAPFIWSEEGIGKELMVMVLRAALGSENVNGVTQGELQSSFSDWKKDCCVAVLDEIKQEEGGARAARALRDQLKDVIANDLVRVHPKNGKGFQILNVTNYMAFSNHKDALAFTSAEGDRRWFVLFCPRSVAEIAERSASGQMAAVARAAHEFGDVLRWWLTAAEMWPVEGAFRIVEEFDPDGRAPMTAAKHEAVEESRPEYELSIEDALAAGGLGIGEGVVSKTLLNQRVNDMAGATGGRKIDGRMVARALRNLGWSEYSGNKGGRLWAFDAPHRVFVKGAETGRDIGAELRATAEKKAVLE